MQNLSGYSKRRISLVVYILNGGTDAAEGIYQNADGTLLHALSAGDDMFSGSNTEVCSEKTHGCTSGHDIDGFRHILQSVDHDVGIVAVRKVLRTDVSLCQCVENECAVAYAF